MRVNMVGNGLQNIENATRHASSPKKAAHLVVENDASIIYVGKVKKIIRRHLWPHRAERAEEHLAGSISSSVCRGTGLVRAQRASYAFTRAVHLA